MNTARLLARDLLLLLACALPPAVAVAEEAPLLVHFQVTGDERLEDVLPLVNAEIFIVLETAGKHRLLSQDQLAEHLIMEPQENLAFCNQDPTCIADLTQEVGADWLLYGDAKLSFDAKKVILHLVLIDTRAKRQADERFGQFARDGPLVQQAGDLVREILGLPRPAPAAPPEPPKVAQPAPAPTPAPPAEKPAGERPGPAAASEPPPAGAVAVSAPPGPSPWTNPWTWSCFGVGVAAIGAGVVLGVLADQKEADATSAANQGRPVEAHGLVGEAEDLALGANISYGVGGALALTAVVLFIVDAVSGESAPAEPASPDGQPTPGAGEPAFLPGLGCGPAGCGASLSLRF